MAVIAKSCICLLLVLFWAAAGTFLFIGSYTLHFGETLEVTRNSALFVPAIICILIGLLLFSVGLIGCFACTMENKSLLSIFSGIILLIILTQAVVIVLSIVYKADLQDHLDDNLHKQLQKYGNDSIVTKEVDFIQSHLKCCGIMGKSDWYKTKYYEEMHHLPNSCCKGKKCQDESLRRVARDIMHQIFSKVMDVKKDFSNVVENLVNGGKKAEKAAPIHVRVMQPHVVTSSTGTLPSTSNAITSTSTESPKTTTPTTSTTVKPGKPFDVGCGKILHKEVSHFLTGIVILAGIFALIEVSGLTASFVLLRRRNNRPTEADYQPLVV